METQDWNELVDAYVDGEASSIESELVRNRAKEDPAVQESINFAYELRERIQNASVGVSEEFSARLQDSLKNSPAWDAIDAPQARSKEKSRGRVFVPYVVGATSAAVAVVAFGLAVNNLRHAGTPQTAPNAEIAENESANESDDPELIAEAAPVARVVLTPSPEGNPAENAPKTPSQKQYWRVVRVASSDSGSKTREFQRLCYRENVNLQKIGDDVEFVLRDVPIDAWRKIAALLDESGACEDSSALTEWNSEKTKNIRVSFVVVENEESSAGNE